MARIRHKQTTRVHKEWESWIHNRKRLSPSTSVTWYIQIQDAIPLCIVLIQNNSGRCLMYLGSIVQTLPTLFKCEWDKVHNYSIASPVVVSKGTPALVYFLKISCEWVYWIRHGTAGWLIIHVRNSDVDGSKMTLHQKPAWKNTSFFVICRHSTILNLQQVHRGLRLLAGSC